MLTDDFLKGRRRRALSADDLAVLEAHLLEPRTIPPRTLIIPAGAPTSVSTLLIDGYILRYMDDHEGGRQIVGLQVAGDFVDLHGFPLKRLDHDVATLSECRIANIPHAALHAILAERPHLTELLWFSTLLDAAMHREWIFRIGRLNAAGRIAHIFCEVEARLHAIGRSDDRRGAGRRFTFPVTQSDLAEMCGITSVHVNRVLSRLKRDGLLSFNRGTAQIHDLAGLRKLSEFDPAYLFLEEM